MRGRNEFRTRKDNVSMGVAVLDYTKSSPISAARRFLSTPSQFHLRRASPMAMEELQTAVTAHLDQMSDLVLALSTELRRGMGPAADNLRAFVRAVDWTEPWLMCLMVFHLILLLTAVGLRRSANFQLFFLFLAYLGVYMAEKINKYLGEHWSNFASQNYFDRAGVFICHLVWATYLCIYYQRGLQPHYFMPDDGEMEKSRT